MTQIKQIMMDSVYWVYCFFGKETVAIRKQPRRSATNIWTNMCNPQEMERKRDLIRQIRALEKVPVEKYKQLGKQGLAARKGGVRSYLFIFIHFKT